MIAAGEHVVKESIFAVEGAECGGFDQSAEGGSAV